MMTQSSVGSEQGSPDPCRLHIVPSAQALSPAADGQHSFALALTATVREPLIVLDRDLRIVAASHSYRQMFRLKNVEGTSLPFCEANSPLWDSSVALLLRSVLAQNSVIESHEIELDVPDIGKRVMLLNAHRVADQRGHDIAMVVGLEDLTAKREIEELRVALLKNQEMLLLEVHHRVANSLQIIASILLLKARAVQSEEVRSHLHDVHRRLISVATVQRQLSVSTPGNDVELGPYLTQLCDGLSSSMIGDNQAVTIAASATDGTIKSEDAVSFGLIVTELVINSLKHGFPYGRKGHIVVEYCRNDAGWRMTVSDDGVGRFQDPAGGSQHVGLGTSIIEALARSLRARVEIGPAGPGAMTSITHVA
jgi:chemotaxis protein methyltransferase CheR